MQHFSFTAAWVGIVCKHAPWVRAGRAPTLASSAALPFALALCIGPAVAGSLDGGKTTGNQVVAIGPEAVAKGEWATSLGYRAKAEGVSASALGSYAEASGPRATAMGHGSIANAAGSVAVGVNTKTSAERALSVGTYSEAQAQNAMALGNRAIASGVNAIAAGNSAASSATDAVALGRGARTAHLGAVALGAGSSTAAAVATSSAMIAGKHYRFAGIGPVSTISVGSAGAERTLTHLAAGRLDSSSTDAVNGSQLNATHQELNAMATQVDFLTRQVYRVFNGTTRPRAQEMTRRDVAELTGDGDAASDTQGSGTKYFHRHSTAADAQASGSESVATGPLAIAAGAASVALGKGAQALADDSVAIGAGSLAERTGTVAVGRAGRERTISHVAAGSADSDAVNVAQLRQVQGGSVQYDRPAADAAPDVSSLSLRGAAGQGTTVHNVADGAAPMDAVNVRQLQSGVDRALGQSRAYTDARIDSLGNDVWVLDQRVDGLRRDMEAGVAAAMGLKQAPAVPGRTTYYAGVGAYCDQAVLGVSLRRTADNGRWSIEGGVSGNGRGVGGYVGVSGVLGR